MNLRFRIPADHPCLPGHFPGRPVVPGVLILDHVQSLSRRANPEVRLAGFSGVKFLMPLLPEQTCDVEFEDAAGGVAFRVIRSGELVAKGRLLLADVEALP